MAAFEDCCQRFLPIFGLKRFKNTQILALKELLLGKDVFVNQATGSGKSLIFQAFPILFDMMKRTPSSRSDTAIVLVICPLVSLMQDQVSFLKSKGIRAAYIGEEQCEEHVKRDIEYGKFQIVYGSPESFLQNQRWRKMLATNVYRENVKLQ